MLYCPAKCPQALISKLYNFDQTAEPHNLYDTAHDGEDERLDPDNA